MGKIPRIEFELGNDTTLCPHENVFLNPQLNEGQYEWQDNSSSYNYTANFPGSYWLTVSNECESVSDTILMLKFLSHFILILVQILKLVSFQ